MSNSRSRNYVFTLNNYTDIEELSLRSLSDNDHVRYVVFGREKGQAGTPHLQGYIEFSTPRSLSAAKAFPGLARAHFAVRRGTSRQASDYCKKDGDFCEYGTLSVQGKRTDISTVRSVALAGGMREVVLGDFNYQDIRIAEKVLSYAEPGRDSDAITRVYVFYGEAGSGKSLKAMTEAFAEFGEEKVYIKKEGSKWWDGYDAHPCVILDDFRSSWWSLTYMLGVMDRYAFRVEFKGGMRQLRAKCIYITCISAPSDWYAHASGEPEQQVTRRIAAVQQLDVSDKDDIIRGWKEYRANAVGTTATAHSVDE